jgi:NAD(P)-dependent dehydrogenase (short-subunit alcohol dehydrogenase family)
LAGLSEKSFDNSADLTHHPKSMSKVIIITGASSGIGKATALRLIQDGHTVYGAARRVDQMQDLVELGGKALELDVTNEAQIVQVVKQIINEQGRIDVLFNNAGYAVYGAIEDVPVETARRQFEVNLFGLARMTQEVLPHMRAQNSGMIINTSSMGGKMFTPLGAWYHASKHALEGWSDCLRIELKQFGIKVVILEPGIIKTEFSDVMQDGLKQVSAGGAYEKLAEELIFSTKQNYESGSGSDPSVVAKVVSKAVNSSKPKRRYAAGQYAKLMMGIRKWLGDGVFERVLQSMVKF